jgi:hypothetical protein
MAVPEAAMDKDGRPMAAEDDIRLTGKGPVMKPEAESSPVEASPHQHFGLGPGAANAAHVETARLG